MNNIEFVFERPWLLLLFIPAFAVVLIPFLMLPANRRRYFRRIFPLICHFIIAAILVLLLAGFTVVRSSEDQSVMLLIDLSDSTAEVHEAIVERAQQIADVIDDKTPVGVLAFADDTVYSVKLGGSGKVTLKEVKSDATNIAAALEFAASEMPDGDTKRMIILSDGKETDGDAQGTAYYLSTKGVRIDAVYFDTTDIPTAEMQISSFVSPEGAYVGDEVTLTVEVQSNITGSAELTLYDNVEMIENIDVTVRSGSNVFELTTVAETSGTHSYNLILTPSDDTSDKNNEVYTYLNVAGESTVLVIADTKDNAETLKNLISAENEVTAIAAEKAPQSIVELCNYDEIILSNVDYNELPYGYDSMLDTYVATYGRSLLVVGGENTYMYGNMEDTAIEEMLPVTFELNDDDPANAVSLMLVLDCSGSMIDRGPFLSLAKQGAIKCVEALGPNDYVGVISFNHNSYVESPLIQATESNKAELTRIISGLSTEHGTYYSTALEAAYNEMADAPTEKKNVIFLSDGSPNDHGYYQVAEKLGDLGVTISTIGLGYDGQILVRIAEEGSGRYYYVEDAEDLPNIMENEAKQAAGSAMTGKFIPVISTVSELTDGIEDSDMPTIYGYLGTTLKDDAIAYITTDSGHPIFASWQYGVGTVACFTSDLNGNWSSDWIASEVGQMITGRMVETTVDDIHRDTSLTANVTPRGTTADIAVQTAGEDTDGTLSVTVSYDGKSENYDFSRMGNGLYKVTVDTGDPGVYELVITQKDASGKVIDYLKSALAVSYSSEYNAFAPAGDTLLMNICRYSGGSITDDLEELSNFEVKVITSVTNPLIPLGIIAALLLIADIAVRKLKWKDVRKYLFFLKPKDCK